MPCTHSCALSKYERTVGTPSCAKTKVTRGRISPRIIVRACNGACLRSCTLPGSGTCNTFSYGRTRHQVVSHRLLCPCNGRGSISSFPNLAYGSLKTITPAPLFGRITFGRSRNETSPPRFERRVRADA